MMETIYLQIEQLLNDDSIEDNFEIRKSSIHGVGAFSKKDFKKDDFINKHIIQLSNGNSQVTKFGRKLNHSINPNAISKKEGDGCYRVYALKDINSGDEITLDYTVNKNLEQPHKNWKNEGVTVDPKTYSNKKKTVFLKVDASDQSNMPSYNPFVGEVRKFIDEEIQGIINQGSETVFGKTNPKPDQETYLSLLKHSGPKVKVDIESEDDDQ
jgi:hypothetical protein